MKQIRDQKCVQCGKTFQAKRKDNVYCSTACRAARHFERKAEERLSKPFAKQLKIAENHGNSSLHKNCSECKRYELPRECPNCLRNVTKCYNWMHGMCLRCWVDGKNSLKKAI